MGYADAKRSFETEKKEDFSETRNLCTNCGVSRLNEELIKYGSYCMNCFDEYCKQAPSYFNDGLKSYSGDPKGWARRIIDRHAAGRNVSKIALKFANEALGTKYDT
jgi:hypothetical protein